MTVRGIIGAHLSFDVHEKPRVVKDIWSARKQMTFG